MLKYFYIYSERGRLAVTKVINAIKVTTNQNGLINASISMI